MYGVPASRTDALFTIVGGIISALFGATPAKDSPYSLICSVTANIWAIISSILTIQELMADQDELEPHFWLFMMALVAMTIVSSALSILFWTIIGEDHCSFGIMMLGGLIGIVVVLSFGLVELFLAYSHGCGDTIDEDAAICQHSMGYVIAAIVIAGLIALLLGSFIFFVTIGSRTKHGVCTTMCHEGDGEDAISSPSAALGRTSALVKVCLLGVFWFLVDGDMSWDFFNGHTISWWVTGQWAKQSATLLNIYFNQFTSS